MAHQKFRSRIVGYYIRSCHVIMCNKHETLGLFYLCNENIAHVMPCGNTRAMTPYMHRMVCACRHAGHPVYTWHARNYLWKTLQEALDLDKANRNDLWWEMIKKEMKVVRIELGNDKKPPPASQFLKCHMIFDIKMEDFRRKLMLVAGGHMMETPKTLSYASIVSRETVQIALTVAALNDLEVKTSDVQNAYLTVLCAEVIHTTLGTEFGEDEGKTAIIVRALYGLASPGASFRNHLADCMRHLGYTSCLADPDLWYRPMVRPEDNYNYYSYVLLYVYNCSCVCHDAEAEIHKIDKFFTMKKGSVGDPDV